MLYVVRDNLRHTESAPMQRAEAESKASADSIAAGNRGEPVAMPDGRDRFTVATAPAPRAPAPTYSALQAEAALCIWEAMLDARLESSSPAITAAFEAGGTVTMRHHALALSTFALAVHDALPDDVREAPLAYDYEIIPAILNAVQWTGAGYVLPPVADAAQTVAAALAPLIPAEPTPVAPPVAGRPGDVLQRDDGWHVVISDTGETDGPMTEAEAREHAESFA